MSLRKLLLPLLGIPIDREPVLRAVELARGLGAHVTVLFCGGHLSELIAPEPPASARIKPRLQTEARALLAEQVDAARQEFELLAREARLPLRDEPGPDIGGSVQFQMQRGVVADALQEAAVLHDAVVIPGAAGASEHLHEYRLDAIKAALQRSGRPVLVLGDAVPQAPAASVAIAWNGSIEGAHAVSAALPVLGPARAVHVLTVGTHKTSTDRADALRDYLAWHGIEARVHTSQADGRAVGAQLLEQAQRVSAELLVCGAYTHNRVRQTLLGGVTHHLVHQGRLSLLLAR